jgi:hypothetical protein
LKKSFLILFLFLLLPACATAPEQTPTPITTNTPDPTITPSPTLTPYKTPVHPIDRIIYYESNEEIPYGWFSYVPPNLSKDKTGYILVCGLHANLITDNYDEIIEETKIHADGCRYWANQIGAVTLTPILPSNSFNSGGVYVAAFDFRVFLDSTDPFMQRPDLKINLMIDKLLEELRTDRYQMSDRILITGFSAGAMFAQRYALLHPERVKAIAAGQCGGSITLPEEKFEEIDMNWPVGINDYEDLLGRTFDRGAYKQIKQMIYIGEDDQNASTLESGEIGRSWRTSSQISFENKYFGKFDPERLENQVLYLQDIGYENIEIAVYENAEHRITQDMVEDTLEFFKNIVEHP